MRAATAKFFYFILFSGLTATQLFAQAGNDNPTGDAGDFNGDVTTGCRYDPYTGNAKRSVTDIVVAGAVGTYPLAFTRTANSRYSVGQDDFGHGLNAEFGGDGNWLHSYQWAIDQAAKLHKPTSFTVRYPDGRIVTFTTSGGGQGRDPYYRGGPGIRDRLQVFWDSGTAGRAYLIMPDGGKVWFSIAITQPGGCGGCSQYTYTVQGIIDPYGQTTTITGSPQAGVVTITEPAGRWIKLNYIQENGAPTYIIDNVTSSDGRKVQYGYTWGQPPVWANLTQVTYFNDPTLVASYTYTADNTGQGNNDLLHTAVDPMYSGPMWKIAYNYATGTNPDGTAVVYGQILSENYFDGTNIGAAVSTLTINTKNLRTEARGDGKTRTFTYNPTPQLISWTDFKGHAASQTYDTQGYVNAFTDFNNHTTNFANNAFTGGVLSKTYPLTPGDTPTGTPRGVISQTYGSSTCADPNNKDSDNPYYVCTATDEGGHVTSYLRDISKRITQINYPDGGGESFIYNSFGEITSHTIRAGGIETFSYDSRGLKQTYRDAYHASGNPSFWYQYDSLDRLSGITDALGSASGDANHTTNYTYNLRGQLLTTTHPVDPGPSNGGSVDAQAGHRYTVTNAYNSNGTLAGKTDEESHLTSFTYDDYRRLRSVATPGHNTPLTALAFYDATGMAEDYAHTDSNVTWLVSPSGKKTKNIYDENYRTTAVTAAFGTSDAATTSYGYDNAGNVTSILSPNEQPGELYNGFITTISYDERNRQMSMTDAQNTVTAIKYDAAGRRASITRLNTQIVTFDSYDAMNRLLQQTVKQTPNPDAVTKYTYYTSGLLHTMQDPHLVAVNSSEVYNYQYDLMGRETSLTYPRPTPGPTPTSEAWHYDTAGRVDTFTNRAANVQSFNLDELNRVTGFSWNDGITPSVTARYDVASRLTSIVNANAATSRTYFSDNLLNTETNTYADNTPRAMTYAYDQDYNRATIQYPNGAYSFTYQYTGRNQLLNLINNSGNGTIASYTHDKDGNLTYRSLDNATSTTITPDVLDRTVHIGHVLTGTTRTFDYGYDSDSNRKWTKRDGGTGDVFGYDLNDQSISVLLNVANPDTTSPGNQTISYEANGNRTIFSPYGSTDTYTTNNLSQYTNRNSSTANYNNDGNLTGNFDGSSYTYDAQDRLISATKGGITETFKYDALSRQVSRTIGANPPVYNVYDGWELIGEYSASSLVPTNAYLAGPNGMVKNLITNRYYYQDAMGSTSHLADNAGNLIEWYRYDLQGTPVFSSSGQFSVRQLFTGQQWYSEIGIYDLRSRAYSPDIGRFLQPDPLRFWGDRTNLHRYVHNNPQRWTDPLGLEDPAPIQPDAHGSGYDSWPTLDGVTVEAPEISDGNTGGGDIGGFGGGAFDADPTGGFTASVGASPTAGEPKEPTLPKPTPTATPTPTPSPNPEPSSTLTPIPYASPNTSPVITPIIMPPNFWDNFYYRQTPTPTPTPWPDNGLQFNFRF